MSALPDDTMRVRLARKVLKLEVSERREEEGREDRLDQEKEEK